MSPYSVCVEGCIAETLSALKSRERDGLLRFFSRLRIDPFLEGDYAEHDAIGRLMQVVIVGRHAVVFWVDHPLKEVKILDLRAAGN